MRPKTAPPWHLEDEDGHIVATMVRHRRDSSWQGEHRAPGRAPFRDWKHVGKLAVIVAVSAVLVPVAWLAPLPGTTRPAGVPIPQPAMVPTLPGTAGTIPAPNRNPGGGGSTPSEPTSGVEPGATAPPTSVTPTAGPVDPTGAPLSGGLAPPAPPTADTPSPTCPPTGQPMMRPGRKPKGKPTPRTS